MSFKRYRLTDLAIAYTKRNEKRARIRSGAQVNPFTFKVRFDVPSPRNAVGRLVLGKDKCPLIDVDPGEVVQTNNVTAQRMIENFKSPTMAYRNGVSNPEGYLFTDVTDEQTEYDIDLDALFASVEV